jgi:DNA-binding CsgD family transcriptional regulator
MNGINKESLTLYKNLLRQFPGLVVLANKKSQCIYTNDYTAKMFGYKDGVSMEGVDSRSMRCPAVENAEDFIAQDQLVIQNGIGLTILDIHVYAHGNGRVILSKKAPFKENNTVVGYIFHGMEIHATALNQVCSTLIQTDKKYRAKVEVQQRSYIINPTTFKKTISKRELDCIFYLLRGNSMKMIAKILNISPRTVESYLEQVRVKLKCTNRADLIEACLAEGYLNYIPSNILTMNVSSILHIDE